MSEKKEERGSVVHDVFPVSSKSATDAVHAIAGAGAKAFLEHLSSILNAIQVENPEVAKLFVTYSALLNTLSGQNLDPGTDFWLGGIYAYEVLRREAQTRGGCLPTISPHEIQTFESDHTSIKGVHFSQLHIKRSEIFAVGREVGENLIRRTDELSSVEPHFIRGFELLMQRMRVNESSARMAKSGAYQMYAVFKTHSEIERIRQMVG